MIMFGIKFTSNAFIIIAMQWSLLLIIFIYKNDQTIMLREEIEHMCSLPKDTLIIIRDIKPKEHTIVDVTIYQPIEGQTDSQPLRTASGFKIDTNCSNNIIGVSRDLLKQFPYGSVVRIDNKEINRLYGKYFVVLDKLNKRYTCTIDILVDNNSPSKRWSNVVMYKEM